MSKKKRYRKKDSYMVCMSIIILFVSVMMMVAIAIQESDSPVTRTSNSNPLNQEHAEVLARIRGEERKKGEALTSSLKTWCNNQEQEIAQANFLLEQAEKARASFRMKETQELVEEFNQLLETLAKRKKVIDNVLASLEKGWLEPWVEELFREELDELKSKAENLGFQFEEVASKEVNWLLVEPDIWEALDYLSDDERYNVTLMAECLYHEAWTVGEAEMLRVGTVVMNRVASEHYPDTIHAVLYDTEFGVQYGSTPKFFTQELPEEIYRLAFRIVIGGERTSDFGSNVVGQTGPTIRNSSKYFELVFESPCGHLYWAIRE